MSQRVLRYCDRCGKENPSARGLRLNVDEKLEFTWRTCNEPRLDGDPDLCRDCLLAFFKTMKPWMDRA